MNLSEALDAALPEIPKNQLRRKNPPQLDPELIVREDTLDGEAVVVVYQRSTTNIYRFPPIQWELVRLFDGQKSFEEISQEFSSTFAPMTPEDVREFASTMDGSNFWYRSSQEKNIALSEKLRAERSRRSEGHAGANLAHIAFSAWDPDAYLTRVDAAIGKYIYSQWFTALVVLLFLFEVFIFVSKWNLLSHDIPLYYNFSKKSLGDLASFWIIFFVIGFFHESSHGLSCKHFGGEVHSMGFMFLYLAPCFYVDVSESWVSATRLQRLATIIAGIWIEMVLCGIAMIVWTNTAVGEPIHDFAYEIILITGLAVIVINMNPLIKLDGYYFFTEWIGIPDLKERSTAFLSGWVQNHIFRLPVDVPIVPRRRVALFAAYAFVSGLYSYVLLLSFVRLVFNILTHFIAEWALLPALLLAFVIFRSRLRIFGKFVGRVYESQKERTLRHLTPMRAAVLAVLVLLLALPIWRDRVSAYYLIDPSEVRILRAAVPGTVRQVYVGEGELVQQGQKLAALDSLTQETHSTEAQADLEFAQDRVADSEVNHRGLGSAVTARGEAMRMNAAASNESKSLIVNAPFDGIVMTSSPGNLTGKNVGQGEELLKVAKVNPPTIRIFVPVSSLDRVQMGDLVACNTKGAFQHLKLRLTALDGAAVPLPDGILPAQQYIGIQMPTFYEARIASAGGADLRPGTAGRAIIFGRRRSVLERIYDSLRDLARSYVW
jgi:putative peptide zinc metalloprotease protein